MAWMTPTDVASLHLSPPRLDDLGVRGDSLVEHNVSLTFQPFVIGSYEVEGFLKGQYGLSEASIRTPLPTIVRGEATLPSKRTSLRSAFAVFLCVQGL
jgi:hypothetical protein